MHLPTSASNGGRDRDRGMLTLFPACAGPGVEIETLRWQLTKLMRRFPDDGPFECRMQVTELDYIASSTAARLSIAETYIGLPI